MSFMRQGQVYLLLGNYSSAASLWQERAIPRLRYDRSMRALTTAQIFGRGDLMSSVNNLSDDSRPCSAGRRSGNTSWPSATSSRAPRTAPPSTSRRALKLVPDIAVRPIIAYYLEKMGQPVPALPKADGEASSTSKPTEVATPPPAVRAAETRAARGLRK